MRRLIAVLVCAFSFTPSLRADVIVTEDNVLFGKILRINDDSVTINRGCNDRLPESVERNRVRAIVFDSNCGPHSYTLPASDTSLCQTDKTPSLRIQFKDRVEAVYATKVLSRDQETVHILLAGGDGSLHGPLDRVASITNGRFCPALFQPSPNATSVGFCFESTKRAVNWSLEPVYNNTVFTKGFSFYLEHIGPATSTLTPEDINLAFGTALTLWSSPLLAKRESLDPALREFVDKSVARSKSFSVFSPPQVVNVSCPANASMIVKLHTIRADAFPSAAYVARAQLQGRTILLNAVDHQFVYRLGLTSFALENRINLITVFAHELGHSFGLMHTSDGPSVMSDQDPAWAPTDADIQSFIAVLRQTVVGTRPGVFYPVACDGLQLKQTATPKARK